jgi:hypothetical protein
MIDIDRLIKSKELQNISNNQLLNESESDPHIRPPRRQASN